MPEKKPTGYSVRPGTAGDLPLVKEICADVFGGNDYIPYVWEEWLSQPQNCPCIVETDEGAAGLYVLRLDYAGAKTGWLQGVRVKAAFRNRGLGRFIIEETIRQSRGLGLHSLQFSTANTNYPMHHLAERLGFRVVASFLNYNFERGEVQPYGNGLESRLVTTSEFDEAYRLVLESDEYRRGNGIYCAGWNWKPLDMDAFRKHLERREVYCLVGALKVLAILHRNEDGESYLAFLAGEKAARLPLLLELARRVSKSIAPGEDFLYTAQIVQSPANETFLQQAGFKPDGHESGFLLYELNLEESAPKSQPIT